MHHHLLSAQPTPLLSGGSYASIKPVHGHNLTNTESFVSIPSQSTGMIHSQYMTNQNAPNMGPVTNVIQNNNHSGQLPQSHLAHNESILNRNIMQGGISTGMMQHNNLNMSTEPSSAIPSQYMQMQPRNPPMVNQMPRLQTGQSNNAPISIHSYIGQGASNHFNLQNQQQQLSSQQSVVQPHGSQPYPSGAFPGKSTAPKAWHMNDHRSMRENMSEEIVKLLKSRRPNANDNWHEKLPQMAKRLEEALYFEANTYEDYADKNTLKQRLQQLAITMGGSKTQQSRPPNPSAGMQNASQSLSRSVAQGTAQNIPNYNINPTAMPGYPQNIPQHIPSHNIQQHQSSVNGNYVNNNQYSHNPHALQRSNNAAAQYPQLQQPIMGMGPQSQPNQQGILQPPINHQLASMEFHPQNSSLRPMSMSMQQTYALPTDPGNLNTNYIQPYPQNSGPSQQSHTLMSNQMQHGNYSSGAEGVELPFINPAGMVSAPRNPTSMSMAGMGENKHAQGVNMQSSQEEHRKQVLKQQQQRLLLLRHASKCPHEHGRCPVTPHCWNMKQLWKHIMSCKDQECKIPHCVSSRYVLSHYSKCKEPTCPVCGPVREAIKRNYLKSQEIVNGRQPPVADQVQPSAPNPSIGVKDEQKKPNPNKKPKLDNQNTAQINASVMAPPVLKIPPSKPKSMYPLDPISCAIYSFTNDQIQAHFKTIQEGLRLTVAKIKELCKPIIEELFKVPHVFQIFGAPVDPISLGIPEYNEIIKFPMDLGTVLRRLDGGGYRDVNNFIHDVHLTFDNATTFNPEKSDVYILAKSLKKDFDAKIKKRIGDFEKSVEDQRKMESYCLICGEVNLKFEPPVYYCNGPCCQKIKRNSTYYCYNNNYHWCGNCYGQIKDQVEVRLPDVTFKVSELQKKKHNEESEEGWVQCDGGCKRWIHQVCGLFNNRRNISDDICYVCPICLQEKRRKNPELEIVAVTTKKMRAADLPKTTLSEFLEKRIYKRLQIAYEEYAENMNVSIDNIEKCPELTLRQVSCLDKMQIVRDGVYNRYKDKGYPADFPCRTKCLVLFQNIDGQDVILFGMYVYEYGHKCPQPNQRRVYISYLDSVHYLRPKQYRTLVYHEILISYLDYVKARGFHTAHIWACPPQKGDDYILYVHPADQKTPKPQILRVWYDEMLKRCVERGIVVEITDLHSEFLAEVSNELTVLPYFEGDYWVNEAEVIIKNLKEGKRDDEFFDNDPAGNKSKRRTKTKRTTQTSIAASCNKVERDPIISKLASIIEPMKDTFFVARLHPKEYAEKFINAEGTTDEQTAAADNQQNETALQEEALSAQDVVPNLPQQKSSDHSSSLQDDTDDDFARVAAAVSDSNNSKEPISMNMERDNNRMEIDDNSDPFGGSSFETAESKIDETLSSSAVGQLNTNEEMVKSQVLAGSRKRIILCGDDMPTLPDDTEDVDDVQECEHFDTRQQFLNLCQGNHYQFDQLRRAKHSSMMVLYHLHNPDAPKFVPTCNSCNTDILSGGRFNCDKCEVDFCQICFSRKGSSIHHHPLRSMTGGSAPAPLTEEQRRDRQRSIQLHMQLLNHAAACSGCQSNNCAKMKVCVIYKLLNSYLKLLWTGFFGS
jgi:E1A/CREB-binding protein